MSWSIMGGVLGGIAGIFALMLLTLPLWRFLQGRLPFRNAVGFWVAGTGFGCLALAAFSGEPAVVQQMIVLGVILAAAGTVVQQIFGKP